ncbi:MAG: penicillin-binding protein activator LpoB, partial [Deltaproteobacteria bacterium]|nr:penicillin-binding protein activator LpoB [Deltaproteobacteria bacterium]
MTTSANLTGQRKYSCRGRITALLVVALAIGIGALAPAGVAQAQEKKARVAILDFEGIQISNAQSVAVTDQLRSELVNIGKFVVLDRAQTDKVMEELAFQQGGMTDAGAVAKVGKLLNVQLIVTGRITSLGGAFQLNVQMINVETAEIERSENILHKGSFIELLGDNITRLAAKLSRVEAPVGNSTMITGNGSGTTGDTGPSKPKWSLW